MIAVVPCANRCFFFLHVSMRFCATEAARVLFCPSEQSWCQTCSAASSIQLVNVVRFVPRQPLFNVPNAFELFFSLHLVRFQQRPPRSRTNAAWNEKCILFFCIPELPAPRRVFCSRLRVPFGVELTAVMWCCNWQSKQPTWLQGLLCFFFSSSQSQSVDE